MKPKALIVSRLKTFLPEKGNYKLVNNKLVNGPTAGIVDGLFYS